jgi:hypothetical protein
MMRSLIRRRAQQAVAGVGIVLAGAASGCWNAPTRPQNQTPNTIGRTNTNGGSMSSVAGTNANPMSGSGPIPPPPNAFANSSGMNTGSPYQGGIGSPVPSSNGMQANGAPNGMMNPNGMPANRQAGMPINQPNNPAYASGPISNQGMSGTPNYMNTQPNGMGSGPIASNAGAGQIQPAGYVRPQGSAPIGTTTSQRDMNMSMGDPIAPSPNLMNTPDPKLFNHNRAPQMPVPSEALPLQAQSGDQLMPTPSPNSKPGDIPLLPPK